MSEHEPVVIVSPPTALLSLQGAPQYECKSTLNKQAEGGTQHKQTEKNK